MNEELRAHLEVLIERRNRYARQLDGLQERAERLRDKIGKIDSEIDEYQEGLRTIPGHGIIRLGSLLRPRS